MPAEFNAKIPGFRITCTDCDVKGYTSSITVHVDAGTVILSCLACDTSEYIPEVCQGKPVG